METKDIDFSDTLSTAVWGDAFTVSSGLTTVNIEIVQENRCGNKVKWELSGSLELIGKLEVSSSEYAGEGVPIRINIKSHLVGNAGLSANLMLGAKTLFLGKSSGGRPVQTLVCSKENVLEDFATISLSRVVMADGTERKIDLVPEAAAAEATGTDIRDPRNHSAEEMMLMIGLPIGNTLRDQMTHPFKSRVPRSQGFDFYDLNTPTFRSVDMDVRSYTPTFRSVDMDVRGSAGMRRSSAGMRRSSTGRSSETRAAVMPGQRLDSQNWRSVEFEALQKLKICFSIRIVKEHRVHFG